MQNVELEVKKRERIRKYTNALRRSGAIPAVVYGKKIEAISIEVNDKAYKKAISGEAGHNAIINLKIVDNGNSKTLPVITCAVQINALTDLIEHIDFKHIDMSEKIKTKVPVELTGEPPIGVKDDGGILVQALREVEVACLPNDIPSKFELNVAEMKIGDSFHARDLKVPTNVELLTAAEESIVKIAPPTKEEEVAAPITTPEEAAAAAAGEVAGEAAPVPTAEAGAKPAKGDKAAAATAEKTAAPVADKKAAAAPKKEEKKK